jgi:hypothetical protein
MRLRDSNDQYLRYKDEEVTPVPTPLVSNHLTSTMGNHVTSSTLGGVGGLGIASTDPYAGVGKYHSTYGNSTGGMLTSGVGTGVTSSSLYRKY